MNQKISTWLGIAVIAVLAGAVAFFVWSGGEKQSRWTQKKTGQNTAQKKSFNIQSVAVPSNWKSYKNSNYEYSFSYPPDWKYSVDSPRSIVVDSPETKKIIDEMVRKKEAGEIMHDISVLFSNSWKDNFDEEFPKTFTLDDFVARQVKEEKYFNAEKIDFAGGKAWLVDVNSFVNYAEVLAENKNHSYSISLKNTKAELNKIEKAFLASFRFN